MMNEYDEKKWIAVTKIVSTLNNINDRVKVLKSNKTNYSIDMLEKLGVELEKVERKLRRGKF